MEDEEEEEKVEEEREEEGEEEKEEEEEKNNNTNIMINLTAFAIVFFRLNSTIYYPTCNFSQIFFLGFSTSSGVPAS